MIDTGSAQPTISIALAGDTMLGRVVDEVASREGPDWPWGDLREALAGADLTILNLECAIAAGGSPWSLTPKVFHFRAGPWAVEALRRAGVDAVCLANNHVLDYGYSALAETLDRLDAAGIAHAGAGSDRDAAERPAVLAARGVRVALVSATDNEPVWAAGARQAGTNYVEIATDPTTFGRVAATIARARAAADLVVFANHWGPNMRERPPAEFREFARAVLDAGADIYFGHSAHVFQGVEVYRGKPLIYDAGDFVDDYAVDPVLRNDRGLLFLLTADAAGVRRLEMLPTRIDFCQVNRATGADRAAIARRIALLSAELGTTVRDDGERLTIGLGR